MLIYLLISLFSIIFFYDVGDNIVISSGASLAIIVAAAADITHFLNGRSNTNEIAPTPTAKPVIEFMKDPVKKPVPSSSTWVNGVKALENVVDDWAKIDRSIAKNKKRKKKK